MPAPNGIYIEKTQHLPPKAVTIQRKRKTGSSFVWKNQEPQKSDGFAWFFPKKIAGLGVYVPPFLEQLRSLVQVASQKRPGEAVSRAVRSVFFASRNGENGKLLIEFKFWG